MKKRCEENIRFSIAAMIAVAVFFAAQCLHAGIILNSPEMWTNPPSLSGWSASNGVVTLSNPSSGVSSQYLRITFPLQSGPPQDEEDIVYANGSGYTGSYTNATSLQFRFYEEDLISPLTQVYLHSAIDGSTWEYTFSVASTGTWYQETIPLSYSASWIGPGGPSQFVADLANIDWAGVYIAGNFNSMQQDYGLDNWGYYQGTGVPEPGVLTILCTAFLSFAILFRRRFLQEMLPSRQSQTLNDV